MPKGNTKKAPKTSKNPRKSSKNNNFNYKILSLILAILLVVVSAFAIYFYKNQRTYEEEKRLAAFESLANSYIYDLAMFEDKENKSATITGYGITEDDDYYIDFIIFYYKDQVPEATQKARLHFQCKNSNGCAQAYWYDEKIELPAESKEKYTHYLSEIERFTESINSAETEEEKQSIQSEMKSLNKEYESFFEEYNNYILSL